MKNKIYVVDNDGEISLVEASNRVAARNHIAKTQIDVRLATQRDLVNYLASGLPVLNAAAEEEPAQ